MFETTDLRSATVGRSQMKNEKRTTDNEKPEEAKLRYAGF